MGLSAGRKNVLGAERGKKQTLTSWSPHREEELPPHAALKTRGMEFCKFLPSVGLNTWNVKKSDGLVLGELGGLKETMSLPLKRAQQIAPQTYDIEAAV